MTRNTHRKFIAAIVSAAMLVTGIGAAPAHAGNDDLGKALAAIVGVAIIGTAIKRHNDRKDEVSRARSRHVDPIQPRYVEPRHRIKPRPLPKRVNRRLLPGKCLRTFDTRRGTLSVFGERCLQKNYRHVNRLPNKCYREVRTRNGYRSGYAARCLRNSGYQLARR